jgi:hypothetical protein
MSTGVGPQLTTTDIYVWSSFLLDFVRANLAQNGLQGYVTFTKNKSRDYNEKWSERSPFTYEVVGSILSETLLNVTRIQCSIHVKRVSQHSAERRKFSPGAPVSSHRKVDRAWVRTILDVWGCIPAVIGYCCCGYPAYMWFMRQS